MKLESLQELFVDELLDLYDAENQLLNALPKMAEAAHDSELRQTYEDHLEETRNHLQRIDQIFERLQSRPRGKTCKAMKGLIEEGEERIKAEGEPAVIDAALIAAAQRVEHYEIAGYGCARTYAELLGDDEAAALLQETLDEEHAADRRLNDLAKNVVNVEAAEA